MIQATPMLALLVEDDRATRHLVRDGLLPHGIEVHEAGTVAEAVAFVGDRRPDIVILGLALPDGSGIEVLEHLTAIGSEAHVLVMSGETTDEDRVRALNLGADDYVITPFYARELTARVLAVLRRRTRSGRSLRAGPLVIDLEARTLQVSDTPVEVTAMELSLLAFLAARPGHVFTRDELLRMVWSSEPEWQSTATVTEHVRRLRAKIEADPSRPVMLKTVRGSGYRFDLPSPTPPATSRVGDGTGLVGVIVVVHGRIVQADIAAAAMLGHEQAADLVDMRATNLIAAGSKESAAERQALIADGGTPRSQVLLALRADGEEIPLEVRSAAVDWQGQAASRVELRFAATSSARMGQLCTGVLSEVTDAVIATDIHLHIRSWNRAAERIYGWAESEVLGRHLFDTITWLAERDTPNPPWSDLEATGRWRGMGRQPTKDGTVITARASVSQVKSEAGEPIGVVSVNRLVRPRAVAAPPEPTDDDIADVRRGLDHREFTVHYQPVVTLADGKVITVEALARWRHPERGLLEPAAFIDIAERSGLIVELGSNILREATDQVAAWRRDGTAVNLAVNLSARELSDPMLADRIITTAERSGLPLNALWLEVTETALVEDITQARTILTELASLGVGISIDDFGTGWASLTYLHEFPVHVLKIDRSFVTGVDVDAGIRAIVRSIISLGAELDLVVVAEGVETASEAEMLRKLGCTIGQGFLYGRPISAADVDVGGLQWASKWMPSDTVGNDPVVETLPPRKPRPRRRTTAGVGTRGPRTHS